MIDTFDFIEQIWDVSFDDGCPVQVMAAMLKPDSWGRRRIVSGRGITREQALQSCLAEATERYCAVFDQKRPGVWGNERELGPAAISPESVFLISDRQYAQAEEWNRTVEPDHHLPMRRDADRPILWTEGHSLAENSVVFVPAACCFLGYPLAKEQGFPVPDSSGLAAGPDLKSCFERGLIELIERDAVSIWWYNRIPRPELRLDANRLTLLAELRAWYELRHRRLWVLDLTTDLQLPVAAAISCDAQGTDLSFGFSAGWTSEEAAQSALGELIQFEATKRLSRGGKPRSPNNFIEWSRTASIEDNLFLRPAVELAAIRLPRIREFRCLLDVLWQKKIETVAVPMSRKDMPFAVARVLAPGLRPHWPRFAPGRLYDVPHALGWADPTEDLLNPQFLMY